MEIKKIENCNYVMFPRLQHCGLKPEHVNRVHNGARPEGTLCLQRTDPFVLRPLPGNMSVASTKKIGRFSCFSARLFVTLHPEYGTVTD